MTAEPLDEMTPWTIKSLPVRTRKIITDAAHDERLTVGQWIERRVDEWVASGSPVRVPEPEPATPPSPPPTLCAASDVVILADAAVRLAAAPELPLIRTARGTVRAALLAMRHTAPQTGSALVVAARTPTGIDQPARRRAESGRPVARVSAT